MAHTTNVGDVTFLHNGDYSGDVEITRQAPSQSDCENIKVPMETLEVFMAERWRNELISYIEGMPLDRSEVRDALYATHRFVFRSA